MWKASATPELPGSFRKTYTLWYIELLKRLYFFSAATTSSYVGRHSSYSSSSSEDSSVSPV